MKTIQHINTIKSLSNDPFGFIVDTLIKVIVNLVIPIPLAGDIVARFKGPVLGFLASIAVLIIMLFVSLASIFVMLFVSPTGFFEYIASNIVNSVIAVNDEFIQAAVPAQNPFGGEGMSYTSVTAGFMDPSYLLQFGKNHTGIDIIPNSAYYTNSQSYRTSKKAIIYSTHSGTAEFYIDGEGGETVVILNDTSDLKTKYIHFEDVYINSGEKVQAGTPLGEMGGTGFATGEHLHYEIQVKNGDTWSPVNPLQYIK